MKNTFLNIVLLILLVACKNASDKTVSKVVVPKTKEETTSTDHQQAKDTVKQKTAIGKTYNKWLNEIDEFKDNSDRGWHSIGDINNDGTLNSTYILRTVEDSNSIEKYIVLINNKTIIDYLEINHSNIPKGSQYYIDGIKYKGKIDKELVAFAKSWDEDGDEEEIITEIYKVYRADKETGKIFEIPTDGIMINADYWGP